MLPIANQQGNGLYSLQFRFFQVLLDDSKFLRVLRTTVCVVMVDVLTASSVSISWFCNDIYQNRALAVRGSIKRCILAGGWWVVLTGAAMSCLSVNFTTQHVDTSQCIAGCFHWQTSHALRSAMWLPCLASLHATCCLITSISQSCMLLLQGSTLTTAVSVMRVYQVTHVCHAGMPDYYVDDRVSSRPACFSLQPPRPESAQFGMQCDGVVTYRSCRRQQAVSLQVTVLSVTKIVLLLLLQTLAVRAARVQKGVIRTMAPTMASVW